MTIPPIHLLARSVQIDEQRSAIFANNVANVATDGFKAEMIAIHRSADDLTPRMVASHNLTQGALQSTENPTDMALDGDGFLVVATPAGERLTRGGHLTRRAADGVLVDRVGSPVFGLVDGVPQHLVAPDGIPFQVAADGTITAGGESIGKLFAVWPEDVQSLERMGDGYFRTDAPTRVASDVQFRQGFLEKSGADYLGSLMELMGVQGRHASKFEALRALDSMLETASMTIGRLP